MSDTATVPPSGVVNKPEPPLHSTEYQLPPAKQEELYAAVARFCVARDQANLVGAALFRARIGSPQSPNWPKPDEKTVLAYASALAEMSAARYALTQLLGW